MLRFEVITTEKLDRYVKDKRALIIDIREPEEFEKEHIENAINIPYEKLEKDYRKMPKDLILVLYCNTGGTSLLAAKELFDMGYIVRALVGGIKGYHGKYLETAENH